MMEGDDFRSGVAVVTGAGSGIGEALARTAANRGMTVIVTDVLVERADAVATSINASGGKAFAAFVDVRDADALERLATKVRIEFGDVRLLVNNAGVEMVGLSWKFTQQQWDLSRAINIDGVFYGVRAFMPDLIEAARRGKPVAIANLSSIGGLGAAPRMAPYIMSKHAVLAFTECLYLEMEAEGLAIDISAILPGPVTTRIFDDAPVAGEDAAEGRARMQRHLQHDGMTGMLAAETIFDGLLRKDFFISTHPDMLRQSVERRAAHLQALGRPSLNKAAV